MCVFVHCMCFIDGPKILMLFLCGQSNACLTHSHQNNNFLNNIIYHAHVSVDKGDILMTYLDLKELSHFY